MENRYHFNNDFGILRDCGTLLLKQVGEMLCGAGAGSPEHAQTFAEVTFAASGRGVCRTDGVAAAIGPGDCYLSFPGETHEIVSDASDPLRYYFFAYAPAGDEDVAFLTEALRARHSAPDKRILHDEGLEMPLRKMCGEVGSADAFSDKMIGLYGKELLIRLYRAGADGRSGDDFAQEIPDKSILVYRIVRYMDDHLLSMTSVSELAGAFNFSYQYLSAVFSSVMGCTIRDYFLTRKMKYACRMLTETALTVTQISERLNYASIHIFSRRFHRMFGVSPLEYRRRFAAAAKIVPPAPSGGAAPPL